MSVGFVKRAVWPLAVAALLAVSSVRAQAPVEEIPVETLFKKPAFSGLVLSPDQKFMAALMPSNGRSNLAVIDLENRKAVRLTNFRDLDVLQPRWVSNERIAFTLVDMQGIETRNTGGLFAIDRDGSKERMLVEPMDGGTALKFVWRTTRILGRIKGNKEEVLVEANDRNVESADVYRMNTVTGRKTLMTDRGPGHVVRWVLDDDMNPRATFNHDSKKNRWWFSVLKGGEWVTAAQWDEQLRDVVIPMAFDPQDSNTLYVASNLGRDTLALFKYDVQAGKLGELVFGDARHDIASFGLIGEALGEGGSLIFAGTEESPGKLVGISYQADKPRRYFFDESAARTQAMIDASFPGMTNSFSLSTSTTLVYSRSDTNPGQYFLFDRDKRRLEDTGIRVRPDIDPKKMAPMLPVSWTARDGVRIDGYLTLPKNYVKGSPVPLILHPHGGPWAKDNWQYNPEVQFMANRGYAVLQSNFRGSTGFGANHLRLSYKHWGDTMIDDMIDGVEWAIKEGYADRKRVAVYGASYGGYATLQAMVRRPDLFKWGVNYVGVTDMAVHQDTQPAQLYSDFGDLAKIINGDQSADKDLFEQQSPARHVDKIAAPVFHAYGGKDMNVDFANGRTIKSAFDKANKPFEWMFVSDEAHGYRQDANVFEFYNRFDKFMKANTPAVAPVAAAK